MKLITNALAAQIPNLRGTEDVPLPDKVVHVKLFHPSSSWTWYVIEFDGEHMCWGLVEGHEVEFGYFSLDELAQPLGAYQLPVERDRWFQPMRVKDLPVFGIEGVAE